MLGPTLTSHVGLRARVNPVVSVHTTLFSIHSAHPLDLQRHPTLYSHHPFLDSQTVYNTKGKRTHTHK